MTYPAPPIRRDPDRDMIPVPLLRAMLLLALSALAIVTTAVVSGHDTVGRPKPAAVVMERQLILDGHSAQAVTVYGADGSVLADLPHGGFITVIQSGVETIRRRHGVDPLLPVTLRRYANGRLTVEDPETGWSAELYAFGDDNEAAFERLMER